MHKSQTNAPVIIVLGPEFRGGRPGGVVRRAGVEGGSGDVGDAEDGVDALSVADGSVVVDVCVWLWWAETFAEGGVFEAGQGRKEGREASVVVVVVEEGWYAECAR